jgi:hypothetical protein
VLLVLPTNLLQPALDMLLNPPAYALPALVDGRTRLAVASLERRHDSPDRLRRQLEDIPQRPALQLGIAGIVERLGVTRMIGHTVVP